MEMRAKQDIEMGQDITPPLPPLAVSLHDSSLSSHCSACFQSLSCTTAITSSSFLRYCFNGACSSFDSSLHFSSAEHHLFSLLNSNSSIYPYPDSSDLRLSLRLLHFLPSHTLSPRLLGLLTNRHELLSDEPNLTRVRVGARAMAMARAMRDERELDGSDCELEETMLCLVITNAVEIIINGVRLGIGVYGRCFSWINHCCSPNSCFSFVPAREVSEDSVGVSSSMRISPCGDAAQLEDMGASTTCDFGKGIGNYGPRVMVRSIKGIQRGEEVTITYTDLLQPTALRQQELLLEYKFFCNCERCSTVPQAYVDHALQRKEIFCVDLHKSCFRILDQANMENAVEKLRDILDSTIEEYMVGGDPLSCCEKVERLLCEGLLIHHLERGEEASCVKVKLSPFHNISLNAYTTLNSAYKIRAGRSIGDPCLQSFDLNRTSAAYSLLLAGATHHLFLSEPSLIASAGTFWVDAGKSLLDFGGSSSWNHIANGDMPSLSIFSYANCSRCSLMNKFVCQSQTSQFHDEVVNEISQEFLNCISIITPKVWSFLIQGCKYLNDIKNPIDFSWIQAMKTSENGESQHGRENRDVRSCVSEYDFIDVRKSIIGFGVHCLLYGGYLSAVCFGFSYSRSLIRRLLHI